jgi:DNA processing protein
MALSIVGSRAATVAGCRRARAMAEAAARSGRVVVSGGALGIDAAAHAGALDAGRPTFAVLGCGVDVVYPDRHASLFQRVVAGGGGLLSEHAPGTPPRGAHFPSRNRIVVALSDAVLVVEANLASGALVTARLAQAAGRRLLAVPGTPGTDGLIGSGVARPIADEQELLRALAGEPEQARAAPAAFAPLVGALVDGGEARAPELARRLGLSLAETLGLISRAELDGWICRRPTGTWAATVNRGVMRGN